MERNMRCYFMRDGHIVDVEGLPGLSDADAIARGRELFEKRKARADGFEIWDMARVVIQCPPPKTAEIIPISSKRSA
jgi:hypothetical protein